MRACVVKETAPGPLTASREHEAANVTICACCALAVRTLCCAHTALALTYTYIMFRKSCQPPQLLWLAAQNCWRGQHPDPLAALPAAAAQCTAPAHTGRSPVRGVTATPRARRTRKHMPQARRRVCRRPLQHHSFVVVCAALLFQCRVCGVAVAAIGQSGLKGRGHRGDETHGRARDVPLTT